MITSGHNKTLQQVWDEYSEDEVKPHICDPNDSWDNCAIDCYGTDRYVITEEHIKALLAGKMLRFPQNDGEYQCFIRLKRGQ